MEAKGRGVSDTTAIAWTRSTFNPWIGCTKVSPGCDHCYAEALDARYKWGGATHWGPGVPRHRTSASYWKQPVLWNAKQTSMLAGDPSTVPWRVFPSLCDPFDNEVSEAWRQDWWELIAETPNLTWLLLTKRIGNAARMLETDGGVFDNVWLGASIVNQEEADRDIPKLLATPAAKRFVSYEPALGPVDFTAIRRNLGGESYEIFDALYEKDPLNKGTWQPRLDQIIVGGESAQGGAKARPFDLAWARSTVAQCKAAGVPVLVKQLGSSPEWNDPDPENSEPPYWMAVNLKDRAGADPAEWPEDLRVQEFPI